MSGLESLRIDLKGLKEDVNVFESDLDDTFFEALDSQEVRGGRLHVSLSIRKASGFYDLTSHVAGTVRVACDLCLDDMDEAIDTENRLVVKLGSEDSIDDDVVTVDENEGILDMSWLVYEFVTLSLPIKHVHAPGKCNPAMTEVLERLSSDRSRDEGSSSEIDSRWSELLKLKDKTIK
jgi:uncharacterized metal-binding protein YceD (DUF177 family)